MRSPFNPYYIGIYYAVSLSCLALLILNLSTNALHHYFALLQGSGGEELLMKIHRTYHIKAYLLSKGEMERWMEIALFYAALLPSFIVVAPLSILPAKKFLVWYASVNESWKKPLARPHIIRVIYGYCAIVSVVLLDDILRAAHKLDVPYKFMNIIQNDDMGFFGLAIKVGFLILMFQGFHYGWSRQRHEMTRSI